MINCGSFSIVGILVVGLILAGIVGLVVVLMSGGKRRGTASVSSPIVMDLPSVADGRGERERVLQQLAEKKLGLDEAEQRLSELDNPVPETIPEGPARRGKMGCGCLVAVVLAVLLPLLVLALLWVFMGVRPTMVRSEMKLMEQQCMRMEQHRRSVPAMPESVSVIKAEILQEGEER